MNITHILRTAAVLGWISLSACLQPPPPAVHRERLDVRAVEATDRTGVISPHDAIARRPTLRLHTNVPLDPLDPPVFLLDGAADEGLVDDFNGPPLRATSEARLIPITVRVEETVVDVVPTPLLAPGQSLSLVLAPWAVGAAGERWPEEVPPAITSFVVTRAGDRGAAVIDSWPADGAAGVAPNLAFGAVAWDGTLPSVPSELTLQPDDGAPVPLLLSAVPCVTVGLQGASCVQWVPERALDRATAYTLDVKDWTNSADTTVEPWSMRFVTAAHVDLAPPTSQALACALDEIETDVGCALVRDTGMRLRMRLNEPVMVSAAVRGCDVQRVVAPSGEVELHFFEQPPLTATTLLVEARDSAGNTAQFHVPITTAAPLPTITISEVRFDPAGPEPQQEYVELFNFGSEPVDLLGYAITDDAFDEGDVITEHALVHPGGRLLLVADDFDAFDPRDAIPAPGATRLRVGSSIANGGLSNSGEALFLRDHEGQRISETPAVASAGSGTCLQRIRHDGRDGSTASFVHDAAHPCSPGR